MTENYFGITDTGKVRDNNEDAFLAEKTADGKYIIACAIDGVGGYSGGEVAAAIAQDSIKAYFKHPVGDLVPMLKDCLIQANEKIISEKQRVKDHDNMACVLTLAIVDTDNNQLHYAHVGDTRLYLFRDNSLIKITNDQSFVGFLEDSGRISEEGAMRHPKRNEIYKALGFGGKIGSEEDYIEVGQSPFLPGDIILLCSDGLSDMINRQEISSILKTDDPLKDKGQQLIAAANKNGGLDNITAVLVQNSKQAIVPDASKLVAGQKKNESAKETITTQPTDQAKVKPLANTEKPMKNKNNAGVIALLVLLCLAFLASTIYLFVNYYNVKPVSPAPAVEGPVKGPKNAQEVKLQEAINTVKGNVLLLNDSLYKSPVIISEAIRLQKDTLFIKVKGKITLRSDTLYKGAAFSLSSKCKFVFLDNITFEEFDTAVQTQGAALQLNNIQFNNCHVAVRNDLLFPYAKLMNGKIAATVFKTDTIPVTPKK